MTKSPQIYALKERLLTCFLLLLTGVFTCFPVAALPLPSAPQLAASSHILVEYETGQLLVGNNQSERIEPASLTKIMTAYLVFQELSEGRISESDLVTVSKKAWQAEGSRMFIEVDKKVSVGELIRGMVIQSGNDASIALAEHIAGSEEVFAELMTATARELGMKNSQFRNATGLPDPEHYTSAEDMALLAAETMRRFPDYYPLYAQKSYTFGGITQPNRNRLLWRDKSVDGFKTGHTEAAGYCLVASANRDGMRLISIVTGTDSDARRFEETQKLLSYGFRFFQRHTLFHGGELRTKAPVYGGAEETVALGLAEDLTLVIPRGAEQRISAVAEIDREINAPVLPGAAFGELQVTLDGELLATKPLLALEGVSEGSVIQQLGDWLERLFD